MEMVEIMDLPIIGETEQTSIGLAIFDIDREGDTFIGTEHGCRVESSAGQALTTEIKDSVPQSADPTVAAITFTKEADSLKFSRAPVALLLGTILDNPMIDSLPTDAEDSRVFDQDSDGNPGVTVAISGGIASGDVYVVQRSISSYVSGMGHADGTMTASVQIRNEQKVIGASNPLLNQNFDTMPHPDPSRNKMFIVPVDATYDCTKLIAEAESLF